MRPTSPPSRAEATVVIIDDEAVNVGLLERLIGPLCLAAVHGFTDPHQAIQHCSRVLPDLVLLDLHMPGLDGLAVMDALRRLVPDDGFLPVLVLTADVTTKTRERVLAAGADDFLTKPFDRTEVLLRVTNLLDTCALHRRIQEHNATLRADLDARLCAERAAAAATRRQHERIDQALSPGALTVLFQPVAELTTGQIVGAEALARFSFAPQPPNYLFTEAAAIGRGEELELAAIAAALEQIDQLPPEAFLALNTSPTTATSPQLDQLLRRHPAGRIVLELTEHSPVGDYDTLLATLDRYRRRGTRIAVDDTGAGYAGLQHLLRIRPDILKLDTDLTRGIHTDPVRRSLAAALVTFAAEIGATITAEGIEEPDELHTLTNLGIPWGQGYHLARPAPLPLPTGPLTPITATPPA